VIKVEKGMTAEQAVNAAVGMSVEKDSPVYVQF
jgi:hypothetical protein